MKFLNTHQEELCPHEGGEGDEGEREEEYRDEEAVEGGGLEVGAGQRQGDHVDGGGEDAAQALALHHRPHVLGGELGSHARQPALQKEYSLEFRAPAFVQVWRPKERFVLTRQLEAF